VVIEISIPNLFPDKKGLIPQEKHHFTVKICKATFYRFYGK
jgi:hypothetical protein